MTEKSFGSEAEIRRITVRTKNPYDVVICNDNLPLLVGELQKIRKNCKILIITDDNVERLYLTEVVAAFGKGGYDIDTFAFPAGENSKNINTYTAAACAAASFGLTRNDIILALGGGVPGDLGGFVAATYMRGVTFVQVPTTLLADIDSSVGGKTAVDTPFGKNLLGAFYQPSLTFIDVRFLKSLSEAEMKNGLGEGAKYAILDSEIYQLIKSGLNNNLLHFVYLCVKYKRDVVERDEYENGERKLLNLGHTIAHSIEKTSAYVIPHGKAVAMGLHRLAVAQRKANEIDGDTFSEIESLLTAFGLNENCEYSVDKLAECMENDKKRTGNDSIDIVKIRKIGDCFVESMPLPSLKEYFA